MPASPTNLTSEKPRPLRRHDSLLSVDQVIARATTSRPLAPQGLNNSFPSSRRPCARYSTTPSYNPITPSSPLHQQQQQQQQSRLHTALTHLSRAAALLSQHTTAATRVENLYLFASPTWSREMWVAEVQRARCGFAERTDGAGGPEMWVERAVEILKREGEEGEFWRDGRDLEQVWERGGRSGV